MRVLIATSAGPRNKPEDVFNIIRTAAKDDFGLTVPPGMLWVPGPGCSNLAFDVIGPDDEAEKFANAVTIALMPAKWSTTSDPLPDVDTYELETKS